MQKSLIVQLLCFGSSFPFLDREAKTTSINAYFFSSRATQQFINRSVESFSPQVPLSIIPSTPCHYMVAGPGVSIVPIQLIPYCFHGKGIFTYKEWSKLLKDWRYSFCVNGSI